MGLWEILFKYIVLLWCLDLYNYALPYIVQLLFMCVYICMLVSMRFTPMLCLSYLHILLRCTRLYHTAEHYGLKNDYMIPIWITEIN